MRRLWRWFWFRKVFFCALTFEGLALSMVLFTDLDGLAVVYVVAAIGLHVALGRGR